MICSNCNTHNDVGSDFCVGCGRPVDGRRVMGMSGGSPHPPQSSVETEVFNRGQFHSTPAGYSPAPAYQVPQPRSRVNPILLAALGITVLFGLGTLGYFLILPRLVTSETLPTHLGMFVQSDAKDRVDEIKRQDFTNAIDGKAALLKDESLPSVATAPNLILYADGRDINVNDLRLIQLDTIKDDGNMQQLDFQVQPVEGKPEMKRIRVPDGLANGKYAFALLQDYFNEGKHKFWAFQVRSSSKSDNGSALKASSFPMKPKTSAQQPAPTGPRAPVPPPVQAPPSAPPGASVAYTKTNNVLVRGGPSTGAAVRGKLGSGQPVYVFGYTGYDCFKGACGPWAQVQTGNGVQGYILSVLLR